MDSMISAAARALAAGDALAALQRVALRDDLIHGRRTGAPIDRDRAQQVVRAQIEMLTLKTGAGNDVVRTLATVTSNTGTHGFDDQIETNDGNDIVTVTGGRDLAAMGAGRGRAAARSASPANTNSIPWPLAVA